MKNLLPALLILFIVIPVHSQDDVTFFNFWTYYSDIENSLYKHFCSVAFEQLASRKTEISTLKTKTDWLQRQAMVRKTLAEIIGPFPEKTPLNVQITGTLQRDGYRIEKIIYESMPEYYVTGALYIPAGITEKAPAIFYACGHSVNGFRVDVYQRIIINLVKKGFVVLTIDPMGQGERYEYWDIQKDEPRFRIPDHEHSYAGAQCLISGYSTARYFIWDVIRGIDYMLTRQEIDPDRIGMTGGSGGGNITAYLGAVDDRILATAPERYITSYDYIYKSIAPQCAEQNLYQMISNGLDHADFIQARAPKPTMLITTSRDFFSIQGTIEAFAETKKMYDILGAKENLTMVEEDTVHKSSGKNREAMYAFFQKHLNNPGSPQDLDVTVPSPEELQVSETGQLVSSFTGQSVFSLNRAVVQKQLEALDISRADYARHLEKLPSSAARLSGFEQPDKFGTPVFSGRYVKRDYTLEKYLIPASGNYVLPAIVLKPRGAAKKEIIVMADTDGMKHAVRPDGPAHALLATGYAVLLFDLPGIGSMGPGYMKGDSYIGNTSYNQWFAAMLVGKSNVGLWAADIFRIVHFAKNDLEFKTVSALSIGPLGSAMLHAAAFTPDIKNMCLISPFLSYADMATTRFYNPAYIPFIVPGAIAAYDLADLMALHCPQKVLIINPRGSDDAPAEKNKTAGLLSLPTAVYADNGVGDNFEYHSEEENLPIYEHIIEWVK